MNINRLRELIVGCHTYGDDGEPAIITNININDDEITFDIHQDNDVEYVGLPLFPYLDDDYIEFNAPGDKEEVYDILSQDDLDESLKKDRRTRE